MQGLVAALRPLWQRTPVHLLARLMGSITRTELVFSLKCFAAAMLAMYAAERLGLPRPFWSMLTAYVVANPLAGAVRSKALYRFCGTLIGSSATVLLVPALSNAPELLSLALALWVGTCLYISLQDRTPRAYLFMLAGYTAALIGFPTVEAPAQVFDTAVARVEEIGLGILCASLVHSLVLPNSLTPAVIGLLDRTLRDSRAWLGDLLQRASSTPQPTPAERTRLDTDRRRLAADLTQLRMLCTHVPFDTTHLRWTAGALGAMQDAVAGLTPVFAAVEDRLLALQEAEQGVADDVAQALSRLAAWMASSPGEEASHSAEAQALLLQVRALEPATDAADAPAVPDASTLWRQALRIALAVRLEALVAGWQRCVQLRREIDLGLTGAAVPQRRSEVLGHHVLHRDRGMALLSAAAAVLAVLACCVFWVATGWRSGSAMAMMAAVFCCFFAAMDDPVPMIHGFLKGTLWSVPIAALYVLALPLVHDFGMLVLLCAPVFLVLGCLIPRTTPTNLAMPMLFGVAGALSLHDTATADFVSFANSMLAQVLGVVAAARITALVRSMGADSMARRIQRATWRELGALSAAAPATGWRRGHASRDEGYAVRMLDRIGLLAPRIAQAGGTIEGVMSDDALRDLRVGADLISLRIAPAALAPLLAPALGSVARFFQARSEGQRSAPPASLPEQLDTALHALLAAPVAGDPQRQVISALVGLRRNLTARTPAVPSEPQGATA